MAKLTRDQVKAWSKDNKNGFEFDIMYYCYHAEKTVTKQIELDDKHVLIVHLLYRHEMISHSNGYGCKWSTESGRSIPTAHFAKAYRSGDFLVSNGLGYWHDLGEATDKKNCKALQGYTADLNDEKCLELFYTLSLTKVNQLA